jgi:hypothetical protein
MSELGADPSISLIWFGSNPLIWIIIWFYVQPGGDFWSKKNKKLASHPTNTIKNILETAV